MITFIGWVDCYSTRIMVSNEDDHFLCIKYVGSNKVVGAEHTCGTIRELKDFLMSLPSGEQADIDEVLNKLA